MLPDVIGSHQGFGYRIAEEVTNTGRGEGHEYRTV